MASELSEDMVLITSPHLLTSDLSSGGVTVGVGVGAAARGGSWGGPGSVELGRRLLLAARQGDTRLVLDLMAKGAPFTTDWLGTSPLHAAAANAHVDTCGVLLRAGVSRDSRTKVERTALHLAAHAGHAAVCSLLLERGAHHDCRDMLLMTPLHWAAERGHAEAARVLLAHGADPGARSKFHKTPLSLAAAAGHEHIVRMMEDALKQREDRDSVHALEAHEQTAEVPPGEQQRALDSIQGLQMQDTVKTFDKVRLDQIKIEIEPEVTSASAAEREQKTSLEESMDTSGESSVGAGQVPGIGGQAQGATGQAQGAAGQAQGAAGQGGAAALLRKHGITLLPHDSSSTVLNAIQSGRTIVLSDAGKLMLKDAPLAAPAPAPAPAPAAPAPGPRASRGVILTAAPVKAPPAGVKVFTLNNKLHAPLKRLLNPRDMQIKLLGSGAGAGAGAGVVQMKPKKKLLMQKTNLGKLLGKVSNGPETSPQIQITSATELTKVLQASNAASAVSAAPGGTSGGAVVGGGGVTCAPGYMCVPAEFLSSSSCSYLRSQLLAAHTTIHELKQRLAQYEPV